MYHLVCSQEALYLRSRETGEDLREAGYHQHHKNEEGIDDIARFPAKAQMLIVSGVKTSPANLRTKEQQHILANTCHIIK